MTGSIPTWNHNTAELRDFINEMLSDMQESGDMDELLTKWNLG